MGKWRQRGIKFGRPFAGAGAALLLLAAAAATAPEGAPAPPPVLDETAYPDCTKDYLALTRIADRLASLRYCRRKIELYRANFIAEYDLVLEGYNNALLRYDSRNRAGTLAQAELQTRTSYVQQELEKLQPNGTYRAGSRRMVRRYRTDTEFVVAQICIVREIRNPNCE